MMDSDHSHGDVEAFVASLQSIPWFKNCGTPSDFDDGIHRVDFAFVAGASASPTGVWSGALATAESGIERLIFDRQLLGEESALRARWRIMNHWAQADADEFFLSLDEKYAGPDGYFADTFTCPHEIFDPPDRLIAGAALEVLFGDAIDEPFFRPLMKYFEAGLCPCGFDDKVQVW